jgi:acyl-CoA thioester hydrolase
MIQQVRVIFGDTDQMGVVYYANYLRWFEGARAAYLREHGLSGKDLQELGVAFPVAEAHCRYRRPAHYEDLLDVDITLPEMGRADGWTVHACLGTNGRIARIPERLRLALAPG